MRYGQKEYNIYEHGNIVNAIWYDGYTFWLAKDVKSDGVGFRLLANVISVVRKMYTEPSLVPNDSNTSFIERCV